MTRDHDSAVVGEMLPRRALHLTATGHNRDAADTLFTTRPGILQTDRNPTSNTRLALLGGTFDPEGVPCAKSGGSSRP